ncbi:MAG TPA: hypothetical protein VF288_10500 [Mycobacteriales bacterium]
MAVALVNTTVGAENSGTITLSAPASAGNLLLVIVAATTVEPSGNDVDLGLAVSAPAEAWTVSPTSGDGNAGYLTGYGQFAFAVLDGAVSEVSFSLGMTPSYGYVAVVLEYSGAAVAYQTNGAYAIAYANSGAMFLAAFAGESATSIGPSPWSQIASFAELVAVGATTLQGILSAAPTPAGTSTSATYPAELMIVVDTAVASSPAPTVRQVAVGDAIGNGNVYWELSMAPKAGNLMVLVQYGTIQSPPAGLVGSWTDVSIPVAANTTINAQVSYGVSTGAGGAVVMEAPSMAVLYEIEGWQGGPISGVADAFGAPSVPAIVVGDTASLVLLAVSGSDTSSPDPVLPAPWTTQWQAGEYTTNTAIPFLVWQQAQNSSEPLPYTQGGGTYEIGSGAVQIAVVIPGTAVPNAPALGSPSNGTTQSSATAAFTWTPSPTSGDGAQSAMAFRYKVSGATAYTYWNQATGTGQSTIAWNPWTTDSWTPPGGVFADGSTVNWSVATEEGTYGLQGPFASDFTVTFEAPPGVTVTGPTGVQATASPTLTASFAPATGMSVTAYRFVVYSAAQASASGFAPGSGPSLYDTGTVTTASNPSTASQAVPAGTIPNNSTVTVYAEVTQTGGQTGWSSPASFTLSYDAPAVPTVTATATTDPTTGCPMIAVAIQGHDNILSADNASFEGGVGGWGSGANEVSAVQSSAQALDGSYSLLVTMGATPSGNNWVTQGPPCPITPGVAYTAVASVYPVTAASFWLDLLFFDADGTFIEDTYGATAALPAGSWSDVPAQTCVAPANAAFASMDVRLDTTVADQQFYVDCAGIFPGGTPRPWTRGGLVGATQVVVTRSDGLYLRGASAASPVSLPASTQLVVIDDYEVSPGTEYSYSAVVSSTQGATVLSSDAGVSADASVTTTKWWELDPTNPSTAVAAQFTEWNPQNTEQSTATQVLGQTTMVIIASAMMNQDFSGTAEIFDAATYTAFQALLMGQKTVFVSSPWGAADTGWFRIGPQTGGLSSGVGNKAKDTTLHPSTISAPHRTVQITAVAQPRPPV